VCHERPNIGKAHRRPGFLALKIEPGRAYKSHKERKQAYLRGPSSVSGLFLFSLGLCSAKSALATAVLGCSGGHPSMLMSYPSNTTNLRPAQINFKAATRGAVRHASQQFVRDERVTAVLKSPSEHLPDGLCGCSGWNYFNGPEHCWI
jgi:hypothetical protein